MITRRLSITTTDDLPPITHTTVSFPTSITALFSPWRTLNRGVGEH
jgi:hypothetical protein